MIAVSHHNDRFLLWSIPERPFGSIYLIYFAVFVRSRDDAPRRFH